MARLLSVILLLFPFYYELVHAEEAIPSLSVLVKKVENPSGTLADGTLCSKFAFAGMQCSMKLQFCVGETDCDLIDFGQISHGSNTAQLCEQDYNSKPNPIPINLKSTSFKGFMFKVNLTNTDDAIIDSWTGKLDANSLKGINIFSSDDEKTSIELAWITTDIQLNIPIDCDDFVNRTNGTKAIYPDGQNKVDVYCEFDDTVGHTYIQSRDKTKNTPEDDWNKKLEEYKNPFGTAGGNHWIGLDNMHILTQQKNYTLIIKVCCGESDCETQTYTNFQIGNETSGYVLNADAVLPIGLNFKNVENSKLSDINAKFSTYETATDVIDVGCDVLQYYDETGTSYNYDHSGGWWFGSCTNNLNSPFPEDADIGENCLIKQESRKTIKSAGIEFKRKNDVTEESSINFKSYSQASMAIFPTPSKPQT